MTTPQQGLLGLQQSDRITAPSPSSSWAGATQWGHSDCRGCTVFTPWVPQNYKELELLRQVYYGGVEHEIRKDVWPFLLGHYKFGMSKKEMEQVRGAHSYGDREMGSQAHRPQGGGFGRPSPFPARKKHGRGTR